MVTSHTSTGFDLVRVSQELVMGTFGSFYRLRKVPTWEMSPKTLLGRRGGVVLYWCIGYERRQEMLLGSLVSRSIVSLLFTFITTIAVYAKTASRNATATSVPSILTLANRNLITVFGEGIKQFTLFTSHSFREMAEAANLVLRSYVNASKMLKWTWPMTQKHN